jgi:UDP-GlcNAc:undecaprenyl-phosphate GlcNAc-1-phosphate transferase
MHSHFYLLGVAGGVAVLSCLLTWVLLRANPLTRLVAQPRPDRWHKAPIPTTGGIAILFSASVAIAVFGVGGYGRIVALGIGIALLGIADDILQLRPAVKLLGQALLAACVVAGGVVFPATRVLPIDVLFTWAWIVGLTNAFNLIDNMDGLCAGVTVIICSSRTWSALQSNDFDGALLAAILGGVYLGFLVFNFNPARIFMGDCGSMFAGFMLASLSAASPAPHTKAFLSAIVSPALTFLYPVFDTVLVSVLRRAAGRPISVGGRDHSSHRLVSLGHSERRVVLILWVMTAAGAGVGLSTLWMPVGVHALATVLVAGVFVFGVFLGTLPTYPFPERSPVRGVTVRRWIPCFRAGVTLILDVLLSGVALLTAFLVRWEDGFASPAVLINFLVTLPVFMVWHAVVCLALHMARVGWQYFGAADLFAVAGCSIASTVASGLTVSLLLEPASPTVLLVYCILTFTLSSGMRALIHVFRESLTAAPKGRRAAILGSGNSSYLLIAALRAYKEAGFQAACILATDPASDRMRLYGLPVVYAGADPVGAVRRLAADVLIVESTAELSESERQLVDTCVSAGIAVQRFSFTFTPWNAAPFLERAAPRATSA